VNPQAGATGWPEQSLIAAGAQRRRFSGRAAFRARRRCREPQPDGGGRRLSCDHV